MRSRDLQQLGRAYNSKFLPLSKWKTSSANGATQTMDIVDNNKILYQQMGIKFVQIHFLGGKKNYTDNTLVTINLYCFN